MSNKEQGMLNCEVKGFVFNIQDLLFLVQHSKWAVPGSNRRPSRCRRDALNQLS